MPPRLSLLALLVLAAPSLRAAPPAEKVSAEDEKLLKAATLADAPDLLNYLGKRTLGAKDHDKIDGLIRLLGDDRFAAREKASEELAAVGPAALPQLRRATSDPDEEIRERARDAIREVEGKAKPDLSAAVIRAVRVRAPAGDVKALLEFLPDAENDAVVEEAVTALAVLGARDGKVDTLLVEALK